MFALWHRNGRANDGRARSDRTVTLRGASRIALATAAIVALAACGRGGANAGEVERWSPRPPTKASLGVPAAEIKQAIAQRLDGSRPDGITADHWKHVEGLYKRFDGVPLWFTDEGLDKQRSGALIKALSNASSDALDVTRYPLDTLTQLLRAVKEGKPTAQQVADADVLLTASYVALAEDLLTGQIDPRSVSQGWHIDPRDEEVDSAMVHSLRDPELDSAIARMRPQSDDYTLLAQALQHYREIVAKGGWDSVPSGKQLKAGDTDSPARLAALRQRLAVEGFIPGQTSGGDTANAPRRAAARRTGANVYDRQLAAAVASWQAHHGIVSDGVLGDSTVQSLNVPAQFRLEEIAANMERHRWLPRTLGDRYVLVNVPAFRLTAFDSGKKVMEMKVIVGQEYEGKKTPVFSDSMETVVFRPYWLVTPDIQAQELAPKIAADPGYMAAHDYEYYKDGGQTRIRQRPGSQNSLGLVKFLFPNDFNIYLHDTPSRDLFDKDVRAFSHGCIRIEKPAEFASWVLGWPMDRVESAMHDGKDNTSVPVKPKLPVYIVYFTAYARDGQLYFGNDLYNRDDTLTQKVATAAMPNPQVVTTTRELGAMTE